jgi:RNA polymerase sigma factor (sigma-70 family)
MPITDEELLAACLRGEHAAWDTLVDRYAGLIYSIPLKYGMSEHDAADVFQAVCVTLFEKLDTIREARGLPAWLITTTSRQCWAVLRQHGRELTRLASDDSPATLDDEPIDPRPLPEDELIALERQSVVRGAVARLAPNCRRLVEALFSDAIHQMSYQELADSLGVPLNSLGPTRARCLAKLRRLLDEAGLWSDEDNQTRTFPR